jgi:nondiscriminating aspartyl-tRNA synthetase
MKQCTGFYDPRIWQIKDILEYIRIMQLHEASTDSGSLGKNEMERRSVYPLEKAVAGSVFAIRDFGEFLFVILRTRNGNIQTVVQQDFLRNQKITLTENACIEIEGDIRLDCRAPNGFEIQVHKMKVLSSSSESVKIVLNKKGLNMSLENNLNYRPVTLRHPLSGAIFKIQEGICRGFRDFLLREEFTEIHTPKIVLSGAEGGSNIFRMEYFNQKAFLAQSPQFYKQTMVGVFDRVFEIGPVFRAEKHNSTRHLNEYTSLDFEMGYIESFSDIMNMETAMLRYTMQLLEVEYSRELELLKIQLPNIINIPCVRFDEGKEMVSKFYGRPIKDPYDLQPEEEQLLGDLFKEKYNTDFVFVTHYPSKKRPFYAMDDPKDLKYTNSFDLLFRGMEITTGGQRIHEYDMQREKMIARGLEPNDFESYLMIHRYGMPPHGGLGIGLERFTMKLVGLSNVRLATLFPRDRTRLTP